VATGAVIEEQVTVRDEKPFFAGGEVYREYVGRPVPVLRTRLIIEAPESLPLKTITNLLPNAQIKETRVNGRVRWTLEQGAIDEMNEMDANLPGDAPAWPSVEFSTGASWEAVARVYRDMTESRIRPEDARPMLAGIKASRSNGARLPQSPTLDTINRIVGKLAPRSALHRHRVRLRAADPRVPVGDVAAPLRRLQGQIHVARRGAACLGHRGLPGAAVRG
jgi:hypothetical protein